jgi:hypothetical protein
MNKWIFSSVFIFTLSFNAFASHKCNHQEEHESNFVAPKVLKSTDSRYVEPYTINADYLSVKPMSIKGFDAESMKKLEKAFEVVEKVVNSEEFKNRILNFENSKKERAFASNEGLTNEQIFAIFMDGRENLQQETPGEMNYFVSLYNKRFSKVIGWTNPTINTININWKFFKNFKPNEVAGNLVHEWVHKIGFGHKSAAEHDSAPYAIGYIAREMGARYLKGEELH